MQLSRNSVRFCQILEGKGEDDHYGPFSPFPPSVREEKMRMPILHIHSYRLCPSEPTHAPCSCFTPICPGIRALTQWRTAKKQQRLLRRRCRASTYPPVRASTGPKHGTRQLQLHHAISRACLMPTSTRHSYFAVRSRKGHGRGEGGGSGLS